MTAQTVVRTSLASKSGWALGYQNGDAEVKAALPDKVTTIVVDERQSRISPKIPAKNGAEPVQGIVSVGHPVAATGTIGPLYLRRWEGVTKLVGLAACAGLLGRWFAMGGRKVAIATESRSEQQRSNATRQALTLSKPLPPLPTSHVVWVAGRGKMSPMGDILKVDTNVVRHGGHGCAGQSAGFVVRQVLRLHHGS